MNNKKLVYLISTMGPNIKRLYDIIPPYSFGIHFLICCQTKDEIDLKGVFEDRIDIDIFFMDEYGLTKSRNFLLETFYKKYENSFAVITDDDVTILPLTYECIERVSQRFCADIVTGRVLTPEGELFSNYPPKPCKHNFRSSNTISSIEMILSSRLERYGLRFDERFGLGAIYKMGEEGIFVGDAIRKGLNTIFYPIDIFIHPKESTGARIDIDWYKAKGAFYARRYGKFLGLFLLFRRLIQLKVHNNVKANYLAFSLLSFIKFK